MNSRLVMDKAGRVTIPKPLREELHLEPGDALEMESAGEQITTPDPWDGTAHQGARRLGISDRAAPPRLRHG